MRRWWWRGSIRAMFRKMRPLQHSPTQWQARALLEPPSSTWIHATLCAAFALGGQKSEAGHSLHVLRREYPDLTLATAMAAYPPVPAAYRERAQEALHGLGLPL